MSDDKAIEETVEKTHQEELAEMRKVLLGTKVDGGKKSVWGMTLETFGMADGKTKKGDVIVDNLEDGLELVTAYVAEEESKLEGDETWMQYAPLESFDATPKELFSAFLKWAQKDDDAATTGVKINVSKACRRLDAYFEWMKDNKKDFEVPLTRDSVEKAAQIWKICRTFDDTGRFVWWVDLGSMDKEAIRSLSPSEHLRYVVWFSHLVMLDKRAQENGAMIIEDMGHIGFWKMMTLVPAELGAKMDRLTIGILPVRMKAIYVFGAASWMNVLITMMKPFMGKKMRQRMQILPNKTNMQEFCDDLVTRKNIPEGFCGLEGGEKAVYLFDRTK